MIDEVPDYVIWGCRSGSKTYLFGGLDTFLKSCSKSKYSTKILGGSEGQSSLTYSAISEFFEITGLGRELLVDVMHKTQAEWVNGSTVSILPASTKSVRGPHTVALKLDEVDEIDPLIYEDALPIPQSMHGHKSVTGMFSTNHQVNGQMDEAIRRAKDAGGNIFRYCIWEILEPCLDYECSTCKLSPFCPGKHMKEADGYYKIEDFVNKLSKMSLNAVMRDYFCKKVGKGDAVYEVEYNEDVNLISASLDYNKPVAISVDWGGTDPFSLGVWQELPTDRFEPGSWVRVTEIYLDSKDGKSVTNKQLMALARQSPWWKQIKWFVGDSGRPDLIQEWREALPTSVEFIECDKKSVEEGIECVKAALKPVLGAPKLYINRICMAWRVEVTTYVKKNDKPVDRYNHTADDTRYFVKAMINKEKNAEVICPERDVRPSR